MNTTSEHRRAAAIAAIALLFVLPLASCQTAVPGGTVQTGSTQPRPVPTPAPEPSPTAQTPAPASTVPSDAPAVVPLSSWRAYAYRVCIERHVLEGTQVEEGVPSVELAKAHCMSTAVAVPQ